jgi:MFS family permease
MASIGPNGAAFTRGGGRVARASSGYHARNVNPADEKKSVSGTAAGAWSALRYPVFRYLWIATVVSNVGGWMYDAAAGWLMTSLSPSPLIVSLVQVANSLPLFLFALPAGALADMVDRRRLILTLEILTTVFSAVFAALVMLHVASPLVLLAFVFLIAALGAIETPAWQAIVPQLVPPVALTSAIATNSVGVNISRVLGPALAGLIILGLGIAAPFWVDAFSNLGVIAVVLWWREPARPAHALPPEHLTGAIRAGWRYARNNRALKATLARAVGFFLFASAYWALLPLLARTQLGGGPTLYGVLLGAIGAGAVGGAFVLPRLKARSSADSMVMRGEAGTALALLLFALAHNPAIAVLACLIAGVSWIVVLATLNVSAQVALPEWVRGRGLAAYVAVFFGTMSVGSLLWGYLAERTGLMPAHCVAAAGALLAMVLSRRWRLGTGPQADLTPSVHWPAPVLADPSQEDAGPVMVSVEYRVSAANRAEFLAALAPVAHERLRDGAYDWDIFEDSAHPERLVEIFFVDSWLEHLRQHQRVTKADELLETRLRRLVHGEPLITHYLAARRPPPARSQG